MSNIFVKNLFLFLFIVVISKHIIILKQQQSDDNAPDKSGNVNLQRVSDFDSFVCCWVQYVVQWPFFLQFKLNV